MGKPIGWDAFETKLDNLFPKMKNHLHSKQHILICCKDGILYSGTVVIAYLMWRYHVPYEKAYAFVQSKRMQMKISQEFIQGLKTKYMIFKAGERIEYKTTTGWKKGEINAYNKDWTFTIITNDGYIIQNLKNIDLRPVQKKTTKIIP